LLKSELTYFKDGDRTEKSDFIGELLRSEWVQQEQMSWWTGL
jgi:hypothetical protein